MIQLPIYSQDLVILLIFLVGVVTCKIVIMVHYLHSESHRKKSERVLVFSELGVSSAAVVTIAYLMKKNLWSLKVPNMSVAILISTAPPIDCYRSCESMPASGTASTRVHQPADRMGE